MSKHLFTEIRVPIEQDNPAIMRHEERCIKCGQCKQVCKQDISVEGHYDLRKTGDRAICIHCGQCANVCPVDCITEVPEWQRVQAAVEDPDSIVVFSTSPSVRVALGEEFEMEAGSFVQDKMVTLLRQLGGDYVLDTNFSADLTIMEEAHELIRRIGSHNIPIPQLTSCCPAWVKFVETFYPEFKENLSTSKSPIGMQGPTIKTYFAQKNGLDPQKIVNVAVTPCTAKKFEIRREEMGDAAKELGAEGMRDMDYVITTRELAEWAKHRQIDFSALQPSDYDPLMGEGSGAGVIFGNSGGVMEAAVRTAYAVITKEPVPENLFKLEAVRGLAGTKEATLEINGTKLDIAVVHGTANARRLLDQIKAGEKFYQFIEVMTCPGGCIGGGGQPKNLMAEGSILRAKRISGLYNRDRQMKLRLSHENPQIKKVYETFYEKPGSEKAERILHTSYLDRSHNLKEAKA